MNKKYIFAIGGLIIVATLVYFLTRNTISPPLEDEQVAVSCANKTVFRYKNPSKIFPVIISDYSTNFSIASGVLNQLVSDSSGGNAISTQVRNDAQKLRDDLNQDNIFFENTLKAYFLASNNDPCNDSLRYMYIAYIKEMTEKVIELKQFVSQISIPAPPPNMDTASLPPSEIVAVIDTAKNTVKPNTGAGSVNKLIVVKNNAKLNTAIGALQKKYEISKPGLRTDAIRRFDQRKP